MDLTHEFTVPLTLDQTWEHFTDIGSVAQCFPGAQVTSAEGDAFQGSCKVKLGPIALVYNGSGRFVELDETARRMLIEAKGKDKRGNGTAGATVTVTMAPAGGDASTAVTVVTDLSITGKPAQFGRGVMQDVSDKLLGQFVACLEERFAQGAPDADTEPEAAPLDTGATAGDDVLATAPPDPVGAAPAGSPEPTAAAVPPPPRAVPPPPPRHASEDSLDLGSAVLPVLARTYGKQLAAGAVVLALFAWAVRRR